MSSVKKDYIASERFIHMGLLKEADAVVKSMYKTWRRDRRIAPLLFTWPGETIRMDSGEPHEGVCILELPEGDEERQDALRMMVERTKAYALLLVEQHREEVRIILESRHGARCWRIPLASHGEVVILERAQVEDDGVHVGLLWSPSVN